MQIRFNIWPGDSSFGGNFNPSILPVYQEIDWVQYSSYANGTFTVEWRDDFDSPALDSRWLLGDWDSPKGLSQHDVLNVGVGDGHAIIALTSDEGVGEGVPVPPQGGAAGMGGMAGLAGAGGAGNEGGSVSGSAGATNTGGVGSPAGGAGGGGGMEVGAGAGGGVSVAGAAGAIDATGGAGNTGGSGSGGVSVSGQGGTVATGGSGVGGAGASSAAGAPGSSGQGAGGPVPPGSEPRAAASSSEGGCTTSTGRPSGSGTSFVVLALAALGALRGRRSRVRF
jgi:hypothetical protein